MQPVSVKDLKAALEDRPDDQIIVILGGVIYVIDPETTYPVSKRVIHLAT